MSENLHELFQTAAKFFFHKYKENGGNLGKLAQQIGTSHTYISAVINGSRTASLEMQNEIAKSLYGPYDKFIAAGRRIISGHKPDIINTDAPRDDIETLIAHLTHYVMRQKEIEKQLTVSRQKFRDICHTSCDIIFEMNEKLVFTYLSGTIDQSIGRTKEEILHTTPFDFLDKTESAKLETHIGESIKNNAILDCNLNVCHNGKSKNCHILAKPVFTQEMEFKGFRGTYRDVTEKIRMARTIEEQKWLFESAIDSVEHVGIVITDKNGSVLKWNKHYQKLMGYSDEVLATKNLPQYFRFLEDKLSAPAKFYKSIEKVKKSSVKTSHFFKLKDGRTIKTIVYPMFRNGLLSGRIAHLTDVTEKQI
jgi:PAS domain S-box-containing protein